MEKVSTGIIRRSLHPVLVCLLCVAAGLLLFAAHTSGVRAASSPQGRIPQPASAVDTVSLTPTSRSLAGSVVLPVLPLAVFTESYPLVPGQTYLLVAGSSRTGSGNWAKLDFNGQGASATVIDIWLRCGYNPLITGSGEWGRWCPGYPGESRALAPTQYWLGEPGSLQGPFAATGLVATKGPETWWIAASTGTTSTACAYFEYLSSIVVGREYIVPTADYLYYAGGQLQARLRALFTFRITSIDTVCQPGIGEEQHWSMSGVFLYR